MELTGGPVRGRRPAYGTSAFSDGLGVFMAGLYDTSGPACYRIEAA